MVLDFLRRRRGPAVAPGQRFRKRDLPWATWQVVSVFTGSDGIAYVALARLDDPSTRKTVARSALDPGGEWTPIR